MKKLIISLFVFAFLVALGVGSFALTPSENDFLAPWQHLSDVSGQDGTSAKITFEAAAHQNIFLDKLYIKTDLKNARVWVNTYPRGATAFLTTQEANEALFELADHSATTGGTREVQVLGSDHPHLPLFVGDKGLAVSVSTEGTSQCYIWGTARRGTAWPRNPSTAAGY